MAILNQENMFRTWPNSALFYRRVSTDQYPVYDDSRFKFHTKWLQYWIFGSHFAVFFRAKGGAMIEQEESKETGTWSSNAAVSVFILPPARHVNRCAVRCIKKWRKKNASWRYYRWSIYHLPSKASFTSAGYIQGAILTWDKPAQLSQHKCHC